MLTHLHAVHPNSWRVAVCVKPAACVFEDELCKRLAPCRIDHDGISNTEPAERAYIIEFGVIGRDERLVIERVDQPLLEAFKGAKVNDPVAIIQLGRGELDVYGKRVAVQETAM